MNHNQKVVIDTNVLVSGLINPSGPPGRILDMVLNGTLAMMVDDRLLSEYQNVLSRKKLGFDLSDVQDLASFIRASAEIVNANPVKKKLPDEGDKPFLEVARAGNCNVIITGNLKHYPGVKEAISPKAFLDQF